MQISSTETVELTLYIEKAKVERVGVCPLIETCNIKHYKFKTNNQTFPYKIYKWPLFDKIPKTPGDYSKSC